MNLSYFTVRRLVEDLRSGVLRYRIQDAAIAAPNTLVFDASAAESLPPVRVTLSASRTQGRITIAEPDGPLNGERPNWIERYLLKAQITGIDQPPLERIVQLSLLRRDRVGGVFASTLVAELMGGNANVLLVNEDDRIVAALRPRATEARKLQQGRSYTLPPPQPAPAPDALTADALLAAFSESDREPPFAFSRAVAALDALTAAEILHRAGRSSVSSIDDARDLLARLRRFYTDPPFAPNASFVPGSGGGISPFALTHRDPEDVATFPSISAAILSLLDRIGDNKAVRGQAKDVSRQVQRLLKSAQTKRDRIAQDLDTARNADTVEKWGSLIMAQLDSVPEGEKSVTLRDLFADGEPVDIPLDPRSTPVENGEAHIKQASKLRKSMPVLERRLEEVGEEIAQLEAHLKRLQETHDEEKLEAIREELVEAGVLRPQAKKQRPVKGGRTEDGLRPRRYRTSDGWEVWVGRTDRENDALTRSAPKTDIWLHAHGCPGSHVILKRKTPNSEPTPAALHDAASVAAYWSKARGAKTVPVSYTEVRYVRKPRGAPPGMVTIQNEKTLFVSPRELKKADE